MEARAEIQRHFNKLEIRGMDNKMKFNRDKCKVLCLGKKKQMHE